MRREGGSSVRVLVAAMIVVATFFATAIVYLGSSTGLVRRETEAMLANGVPSADRLTDARASLRKLDAALSRALLNLMEGRALDCGPILAARREVSDDIADYRTLPFYAYEADLNRDLDVQLTRLDDTLQQLFARLQRHDVQGANQLENGPWRLESDRVDDRLRTLIMFNMRHVARHALRIDGMGRQAAVVGLSAGGLGMLLALAATVVAARSVRRQLELQAERTAELELFSARVAHDVMSPLTSVLLRLELAREQFDDAQLQRMTEQMLATLRRVRAIVDGLYDFARAGGKPVAGQRASVSKMVADVCEEKRAVAERERVELSCPPAPACEVACAPGVLAVLLGNLVDNAFKFMGESPVRRVTVETQVAPETVRFIVSDTGPGLPLGAEEVVFQPYVRARVHGPGLGLGLATVKRLVEAHGGRVGFERGGTGVRFWFELPRVPGD
jgi:signal transduction histidine kinase